MINTILFEIILLALTIMSPDVDKGTLDMKIGKNETVKINFIKIVEGAEEDHQFIRYEVVLHSSQQPDDFPVLFEMVDNGLYEVTAGEEDSFTLDMVSYYIQLDWQERSEKKQVIQDSFEEKLILTPRKHDVELNSVKGKMKITIPRKYFGMKK